MLLSSVSCVPDDAEDGVQEADAGARPEAGRLGPVDSALPPDLGPRDSHIADAANSGPAVQDAAPVLDAAVDAAPPPPMDASQGFRCTRNFECNDGNPCTDNVCAEGECLNPFNDAPCGDALFCNGLERCQEGACAPAPIPCPSADDCDEARDRCTACEIDAHCPDPEVVSQTICQYDSPCTLEGTNTEIVANYACVDGACAATQEEVPAVCARETDGSPCGGGATCTDGTCPRDPLVNVVCSGFPNFNARFTARCVTNGEVCIVQGNAVRGDRGVNSQRCEIICPPGGTIDLCCSNGSIPCGGDRAPIQGNSRITEFRTTGLADSNCALGLGGGQVVECGGLLAEQDVTVECVFGR